MSHSHYGADCTAALVNAVTVSITRAAGEWCNGAPHGGTGTSPTATWPPEVPAGVTAPPSGASTAGSTDKGPDAKGPTALPGVAAPPTAPAHLILVDQRLRHESHEDIVLNARPNTEVVYIAKPGDMMTYLEVKKKKKESLAALESINLLFHGSPYDADGKPIDKTDPYLATKAATIEVLGAKLSVQKDAVEKMIKITPESPPAEHTASRTEFPRYWELRDAMVALWYATAAPTDDKTPPPFYLYACNLAQIPGFKRLFTGFKRPVFGSTDITGPKTNWDVEWESEEGEVTEKEKKHAQTNLFDSLPKNLELPGETPLYLYNLLDKMRYFSAGGTAYNFDEIGGYGARLALCVVSTDNTDALAQVHTFAKTTRRTVLVCEPGPFADEEPDDGERARRAKLLPAAIRRGALLVVPPSFGEAKELVDAVFGVGAIPFEAPGTFALAELTHGGDGAIVASPVAPNGGDGAIVASPVAPAPNGGMVSYAPLRGTTRLEVRFADVATRSNGTLKPVLVYFVDDSCIASGANHAATTRLRTYMQTSRAGDAALIVCATNANWAAVDEVCAQIPSSYAFADGCDMYIEGAFVVSAASSGMPRRTPAAPALAVLGAAPLATADEPEYVVLTENALTLEDEDALAIDPLSLTNVLNGVMYTTPAGWRPGEPRTVGRSFGDISGTNKPICLYFANSNSRCTAVTAVLRAKYNERDSERDFEIVLVTKDEEVGTDGDTGMPWPAVDADAANRIWRACWGLYGDSPKPPALMVLSAAEDGRSYVVQKGQALTYDAEDRAVLGSGPWRSGPLDPTATIASVLQAATLLRNSKEGEVKFYDIAVRTDTDNTFKPVLVFFVDRSFMDGALEALKAQLNDYMNRRAPDAVLIVCAVDGSDVSDVVSAIPSSYAFANEPDRAALVEAYTAATGLEAPVVPSLAVLGADPGKVDTPEYFVLKMNALTADGALSYDPLGLNDMLASVMYITPEGWRPDEPKMQRSFTDVAFSNADGTMLRPICLYFASVKGNAEARQSDRYDAATLPLLKLYKSNPNADFEVVLINTDPLDPSNGPIDGEPSDADMPWPAVDYTHVTGDADAAVWMRRACAALCGAHVLQTPALVVLKAADDGSYFVDNPNALKKKSDESYALGNGPWEAPSFSFNLPIDNLDKFSNLDSFAAAVEIAAAEAAAAEAAAAEAAAAEADETTQDEATPVRD
jgi:hypothetical protein